MTARLLLAIALAGALGCHRETKPAPPAVSPVDLAPLPRQPPPPPKAVELPSDGQVLRDLAGRIVCESRGLGERLGRPTIKKKAVDEYEKDECNVVAEVKTEEPGFIRYTLVYQRRDDFWKLRGIESTIEPEGYPVGGRCR